MLSFSFLMILMLDISSIRSDDVQCDEEICHESESKSFYIGESSDFDDSVLTPTEFRTIERPPHVIDENKQYSVTFHNECDEMITIFWLNGDAERENGQIQPNDGITIGTYIGHKFFYRLNSDIHSTQRLQVTTMNRGETDVYFKSPELKKQELKQFYEEKEKFVAEYYNKTGIRWTAYYPRAPPKLHMFKADFVGQTHPVSSKHSFYHCYPKTDKVEDVMACRGDDELQFEWKMVATSPKVMWLDPPFLSEFEMDHIMRIANKSLNRSTIGQDENIEVSYSRTSLGAWVQRHESEVIDWIFKRIGDVTKIDESHLWPSYGCEQLQVLKYEVGQQFYPHPDYNTDKKGMRFLTFLMYLNDVEEGGETDFPKVPLKVTPKKGHVAAFYSALEDGNADIQSLHAGLPIIKGVKWAAPLWIWDPYFER